MREYQHQLLGLPSAIAHLEDAVTDFKALHSPFASVINYIFESVNQTGFGMKEVGSNAFDSYEGQLVIQPSYKKSILFKHDTQDYKLHFYIVPDFKTVEQVTTRKFRKDKVELVETTELESLKIIPLRVFNGLWSANLKNDYCYSLGGFFSSNRYTFGGANHFYRDCHNKDRLNQLKVTTPERFVDELLHSALQDPDSYMDTFKSNLRTIFSLPQIMHNYATRVKGRLTEIVSSTAEQIMNGK